MKKIGIILFFLAFISVNSFSQGIITGKLEDWRLKREIMNANWDTSFSRIALKVNISDSVGLERLYMNPLQISKMIADSAGEGGGGSGDLVASDSGTTYETPYAISYMMAGKIDTSNTRLIQSASLSDSVVFIGDSVGESALYWSPSQITAAVGEGGGTSYDSVYIYTELYRIRDSINGVLAIHDSRITQNENDIISLYALIEGLGGEVPPRFDSANIAELTDSVVYIFLSKGADSVPNFNDFTITENGGSVSIDSVTLSSNSDSLIIWSGASFTSGTTVLSSYTPNLYPRLQDDSGNENTGWTNKPVENNLLGTVFSDEYTPYYNQLAVKPSETIAQHQDTLFRDIVAYGLWDTIKSGFILAQESNISDALIDIINPSTVQGTSSGSPTFTSLEGIAHNGSTSYTDLKFTPSDYPYLLNAMSIGIYSRTATSNNNSSIGAVSGTGNIFFTPQHTDNQTYYGVNTGAYSAETNGTGGDGFYIFNRINATTVTASLNGTVYSNQTQASSGLPNIPIWIGGYNNGGSLGEPSNYQLSVVLFMGLLTPTQQANLNTAVEKYMDAIGTGVQ